jgi:hypothetical protein
MADPITAAIVSSIIGAAIEGALTTPPPPEPAMGIVRMLPEETKLGKMQPPTVFMQVQIDGKTLATSPGVQIRNELNMLILPTMVQQSVKVRYLTDYTGAVYKIWILSSAEARLPVNR